MEFSGEQLNIAFSKSFFFTSPPFEYFSGLTVSAHERIAIPACSLVIGEFNQ